MGINRKKAIAAAQRYTQKGQLDKAIHEYQLVIESDPDDVRILLKIGDLYTKKGAVREAVETYNRVAKHYSEKQIALKAVAVYKQILNLDPSFVEANAQLARQYVHLGLIPDAISQYQIVVGRFERDGRHAESVTLLEKICHLAPDDVPARIRFAEAFVRQNDKPRAVLEFRPVLETLAARQRLDEYIQVAERVLFLAPDDQGALLGVADVYLRRGDAKRALARLQVLFRADPTNVSTLTLLARVFQELGQSAKAVSVYREVARIEGEAGNRDGQSEAYRRILAIDPTDVEARQAAQHAPASSGVPGRSSHDGLSSQASSVDEPGGIDVEQRLRDVELLLKYKLEAEALEILDLLLAHTPDDVSILLRKRDLARDADRKDVAADALVALAKSTGGESARNYVAEALELDPGHAEAQAVFRNMQAGTFVTAAPGQLEPVPLPPSGEPGGFEFDEFDLDADGEFTDLDLAGAEGVGSRALTPAPMSGGLDELDALLAPSTGAVDSDPFGDLLTPATPPTTPPPIPPATPPADEFGDLLGVDLAGDEFGDLLQEAVEAPAVDAFAGDEFGDLLASDEGRSAAETDEFADLLQGDVAGVASDSADIDALLAGASGSAPAPIFPGDDGFGELQAPGEGDEIPTESEFGRLLAPQDAAPPDTSDPPPPPSEEDFDQTVNGLDEFMVGFDSPPPPPPEAIDGFELGDGDIEVLDDDEIELLEDDDLLMDVVSDVADSVEEALDAVLPVELPSHPPPGQLEADRFEMEPVEFDLLDSDYQVIESAELLTEAADSEEDLLDLSLPPAEAPPEALGPDETDEAGIDVALQGLRDWPDIADDLEELDFFLDSGLLDDARELLVELAEGHGAHPDLSARSRRLDDLGVASAEPEVGTQVSDLTDEDLGARFDLGLAFKEMGQYAKAIEQFEAVQESPARRASALHLIGLCCLEQADFGEAARHFDRALAAGNVANEARAGILYDLATAHEGLGNEPAALDQLRAIVDAVGDFLDVRQRIDRLSTGRP